MSSLSPPRKIKRIAVDYSEDKQTIQTSTNHNDLFKKIDERIEEATTSIEAKMDVLKKIDERLEKATTSIEAKMDVLQGQMKFISDALAENKILIKNCLRQNYDDESVKESFPILSEEQLIQLENKFNPENKKQYIKAVRSMLEPAGVQKNLRRIMGDDLIMAYNVEGVQGKQSLKQHTNFYAILLEAISMTNVNCVGPADEHLRKAIQVQKRRIFKNLSLARNAVNAQNN